MDHTSNKGDLKRGTVAKVYIENRQMRKNIQYSELIFGGVSLSLVELSIEEGLTERKEI